MTTAQLVLIIGLVLIAAILIMVILRRGSQRREEHRVEAEELRSDAQGVMAAMTGQASFAQQAEERADVARDEAEEKAREAERLEAEAAEQQRTAEASRQEYEAMMRRADDIDPDVKESEFPPVQEDAAPEPAPEQSSEPEPTPDGTEDVPMTRAERRRVREEAEAQGARGTGAPQSEAEEESSVASGSAAPVAGAAAAAAVGTAAWAAHDDHATDDEREHSSRIASAADYRDDTGEGAPESASQAAEPDGTHGGGDSDPADQHDVWGTAAVGTAAGMSQSPHDDVTDSTDPPHDADGYADRSDDVAADAAADAESPRGEWGGPRNGEDTGDARPTGTDDPMTEEEPMTENDSTDTRREAEPPHDAEGTGEHGVRENQSGDGDTAAAADGSSGMTMLDDPESYAATEPVLAADQAPPVEPPQTEHSGTGLLPDDPGTAGDEAGGHTSLDEAAEEGTDAVILADTDTFASAEPRLADGSSAATREEWEAGRDGGTTDTDHDAAADDAAAHDDAAADGIVAADAHDDESSDWGRSEGDRLEENRERGEQLAADREALDREAAGEESAHAHEPTADDAAADADPTTGAATGGTDDTVGEADDDSAAEDAPRGRRVSDFHEIRDGGFGVGSAAPLEDGAQPMDHPVAGYRDTMSFRTPGDAGYEDADPDVWFYDESAAERSGFHRFDG